MPLLWDKPVNILLVDDQPAKLLSYEAILGELGENLIKADSPRAALEHLLKNDIALILIDVCMPELDGFQLAEMIHQHPRFAKTAMIFVSAIHLTDLDRLRGYECGAVDYISVPVVPEILRAKVKVFAELYRKTRQLERLNAELEERVAERTAALEASAARLAGLNAELEERVRERTAELVQLQKIESMGQLTGGIAHDFNNLLSAILTSLEVLRVRVGDDPKNERLLEGAIQGVERGAALTKRMLAFARRQELEPAIVRIPDLLAGMEDLLERSLGPLVSVATQISPDLGPAHVDRHQLEVALLNLAVNARDAMPEGGRLVIRAEGEVVAEQTDSLPPGCYIRLTISDSGSGMDEATLARATEPFYTTKEVGKGTGLGLSMVHGLVTQSGGAMQIDSHVGAGTSVTLWLPQAQAISPVEVEEAPAESKTAQGLTILVVDDDPLVRTGMVALLEHLGHAVVETASAEEALSVMQEDRAVDLLITDQAMPGMTGYDLISEVKKRWPEVPTLLATGFAELPDEAQCLSQLHKPYDQRSLTGAIAAAVEVGKRTGHLSKAGMG